MEKRNKGIRPQDIVIILKKMTSSGKTMLNKDIGSSLGISPAEISYAMERCRVAQLVDATKSRINTLALKEFLVYGLKYVFPAVLGRMMRGVPTAVSASPIKEHIVQGNDVYVWPYKKGTVRGQSVSPLYRTVPEAVANDEELYRLLVIVDALRMGRMREREIAMVELDKAFEKYGQNES
jgi:hypothetical protein